MTSPFTAFAALLLAVAATLTAAGQPAIHLRMAAGKTLVDDVYLNGQGPFRFLLDTGAQTNEIDAALARKLAFLPAQDVHLFTPSGSAMVHTGRAATVALGSSQPGTMQDQNEEFLLTDLQTLRLQLPDLQGVLGQEFLAHFDYTLDMAHKRLIPGPPSNAGAHIPARLIAGRMAISTSQGDLILDSGADLLCLFRRAPHAATGQLLGAAGTHTGIAVEAAPELAIAGRRYHTDRAGYLAIPQDPAAESQEAGLLPLSLFKSIFISNSGAYIMLNPE